MALPKLFQRIFFHNNTTPALNEDNLNAMSKGLSDVDDRLIDLAGTIMEDVPEIQHDLEILEPAIENIDANVARAETAADNAETEALKSEGYALGTQDGVEVTSGEYYQNNAKYYAEIANPPIENTVDFTDIITISDAINKAAKDVRLKVEAVQDLHGYTKPWVGGSGKNKLQVTATTTTVSGVTFTVNTDGTIKANGTASETITLNLTNGFIPFPSGTYVINGGVNNNIRVYANPDRTQGYYSGGADSVAFNVSTELVARIQIENGTVCNNALIYPMIRLASVSDPTYEPYENICPISGWDNAKVTRSGKNILPITAENATSDTLQFTVNKNSSGSVTSITWSGKREGSGRFFKQLADAFILPAGSYILSGGYNSYASVLITGIRAEDTGRGATFVSDGLTAITPYAVVYNGRDYDGETIYPMIRLATETDATYEPYQGEAITVSLNGIRYGGTLDVDSGVLTVDKVYKELTSTGSETWYTSTGAWANNFYTTWTKVGAPISGTGVQGKCSAYKAVVKYPSQLLNGEAVLESKDVSASFDSVCVRDTRFTTVEDFKASLTTPLQVVYPLATPQTIQLTAEEIYLLYGYNTLFGDCGDISLTYDASGIIHIEEAKLDTETLKTIAAASSDFADFKARIAAL